MRLLIKFAYDEISERVDSVSLSASEIDASKMTASARVLLANGLAVFLAAVIEESIRELVKSYLLSLQKGVVSPDQLPTKLIQENYRSIGEKIKVLGRAKDTDAPKELIDVFESVNNAHISGGAVPFDLRRLTNNQGNMKSTQVSDIFSRVGIGSIWEKVVLKPEIIQLYPSAQPKQLVSKFVSDWNKLLDERDKIMHQNSTASGIGTNTIKNYAVFFKTGIASLAEILDEEATKILN